MPSFYTNMIFTLLFILWHYNLLLIKVHENLLEKQILSLIDNIWKDNKPKSSINNNYVFPTLNSIPIYPN